MTIEQKKALHAKQKAARGERWSGHPYTHLGSPFGKGKRKMGDRGTIISTRPLKNVIPAMARQADSTSQSHPSIEVQPTPTIDLDAQLEIVDLDGMPKKRKSSSAPFGNKVQSLWDNDFDARSFLQSRLDFSIDFHNDHHMAAHMGASQMSNALETHMLRGFLIERAMFDAHCQSDKLVADLKVQLNTQREVATEAHNSLKSLIEERD